jgi:hypothetical protein
MRWRRFLFSSKTGSKTVSSKLAVAVVEFQSPPRACVLLLENAPERILPACPVGPLLRQFHCPRQRQPLSGVLFSGR